MSPSRHISDSKAGLAVILVGETHWLRIPVGKLHNDRYIPLHPRLVDILVELSAWRAQTSRVWSVPSLQR